MSNETRKMLEEWRETYTNQIEDYETNLEYIKDWIRSEMEMNEFSYGEKVEMYARQAESIYSSMIGCRDQLSQIENMLAS